jgi:hypothetical protein
MCGRLMRHYDVHRIAHDASLEMLELRFGVGGEAERLARIRKVRLRQKNGHDRWTSITKQMEFPSPTHHERPAHDLSRPHINDPRPGKAGAKLNKPAESGTK